MSDTPEKNTAAPAGPTLKKELTTMDAVSIIGGIMIGSGVFYVGSFVIERTNLSMGLAVLAWIFAGLYSLMAGLCYAELGAAMPKAGGSYVYLREAYNPMVAFMMGWTDFWINNTATISALALGFSTYFALLVPMTDLQMKLMAAGLIVVLSIINMFGVKTGGRFQSLLMVAKLIPIGIIIVVGLLHSGGSVNPITFDAGGKGLLGAFSLAVIAALWSFDGWSSVTMVTEEIKDPQKNLPRAMLIAIGGVTAIYVLFNFVLMKLIPAAAMAADPMPAATAATVLFGKTGAVLVTIGILISVVGSCNGCILAFPREYYAMAKDKRFFSVFGKLNPKYGTPINSQIITMLVAIAVLFVGSFEQITTLVVFASWIFYTLAMAAVFILRKKYPNLKRPYKVPGYPILPALTVLCACGLLINSLIEDPRGSFFGILIPIIGIPVYLVFKKKYPQVAQTRDDFT